MSTQKLIPISNSAGLKSISDDDLCSECKHCDYKPGEMSGCQLNWPGMEKDGYVFECKSFGVGQNQNQDDLAPVLVNGEVEFLPIARSETPTWLIVVKAGKKKNLTTTDPSGDRIFAGGVSVNEAIGYVLRENPKLSYDDIVEHMEV